MRIAVLGCGSIGRRHLANLGALGYRDVVAFDPDPAAQCVQTLEEVWDFEPEVALITAPSQLHIELARVATQHGCNLFIEKPLSHTLDGVDELCAEVKARRLVAMVGCNMRFHPGPAAVKRLIESKAVGDVIAMRLHTGSYLPRWRPWQDYRQSYSASAVWGGATLDCIHEIDLALWFGGPAKLISAASVPARTLGLETEGLTEMLLRHDSGALTNVHLNFVQRDYHRGCEIIGSEGTLRWDFGARRVDRFGADGEIAESFPEPEGWQLNDMYVDELRHFLDCVAAGRPAVNPLHEAKATLRLALEARRS